MTPAQRHELARDIAVTHADVCPHCTTPSLDRPMTTRCRTGMAMDGRMIATWRTRIDALTDRAVR